MRINRAACVFPVSDLEASLRYFVGVLGFAEDFRFGQYAGVQRDDCRLHLTAHNNPGTAAPGTGAVYLFCDEVDDYYAQVSQRGAVTEGAPQNYDYGLRDFIVRDPDGNQLSFGAPITGA